VISIEKLLLEGLRTKEFESRSERKEISRDVHRIDSETSSIQRARLLVTETPDILLFTSIIIVVILFIFIMVTIEYIISSNFIL